MGTVQDAYVATVMTNHDGDGCLIWPFTRNSNGYGFHFVGSKRVQAHRIACELANGPDPSPKHEAAHECGCGHLGCVSPKHLSWKTRRENARDAIKHGTSTRGERHGCVVLEEQQVRFIRSMKGVISQRQLAKQFNVSSATVAHIHTGRNWGWLQ